MNTTLQAKHLTRRVFLASDPMLVSLGSVLPGIRIIANGNGAGNKRDADFVDELGGSAVNCGRFGVVNGFPTAVIGVQQAGWASGYSRDLLQGYGLRPLLIERANGGPYMSIISANCKPGSFEILTKRPAPPAVNELTLEMAETLGIAQVVMVGPMQNSAEARDLLAQIPLLAPRSFRALIPHPSLIEDPAFPLLAKHYHYTQMNFTESMHLRNATSELPLNALLLKQLVGDKNACAVTNGPGVGRLWTSRRWLAIEPLQVDLVDETCCGDSFAAALVVGWRLIRLSIDAALRYALEAASTTATQVGLKQPLAYQKYD